MVRDAGMLAIRRRRRLQRVGLAVLACILTLVVGSQSWRREPAAALADATTATGSPPAAAAEDEQAADTWRFARVDVTWPTTLRRDVFVPPVPTPVARTPAPMPDERLIRRDVAQSLRLNAIVFGRTPQAIINGRLWREGDEVSGYQIVRIEPRRITVQKDAITVELSL